MEPMKLGTDSPENKVVLLAANPLRSSDRCKTERSVDKQLINTANSSDKLEDPLTMTVWVGSKPAEKSDPETPYEDNTEVSILHQKPSRKTSTFVTFQSHNDVPPYDFDDDPDGPSPYNSCESILASRERNRRVILNVGGERHEILWESLAKYPNTRLGQLNKATSHEGYLELCSDYTLTKNEFFFDRQSRPFAVILNLYRKGKLHLAEDLCVMDFTEDLQYWGVDELYLDSCCQIKFQQRRDAVNEELKKDAEVLLFHEEDYFGKGRWAEYREYVWDLFEKSVTLPQRIIGMMSICIIILSIVTLSLSTLPELQEYHCTSENTTLCDLIAEGDPSDIGRNEHFISLENYYLEKMELFCVAWFTFEYIVRLICSPSKRKFFRGWLNNIDLLAIAPFYVSLFLVQFDATGRLLQVLRVIRILRIFKLARHSVGLQSLGFTLRHSYQNLGVLLLFLTVGVIIFSTLAYFAEREVNKNFDSIPHATYWALVTMTTVGYGDVTPITFYGKIIGMITGVCGVVVIALPIPIVVNNFGLFYEEQKRKEKALKRQKALAILKEKELRKGSTGLSITNISESLTPSGIVIRKIQEMK